MAKYSTTREYTELTADECFNRAGAALSQSGYEILKKRDFAWLVIGKMKADHGMLEANISARPGSQTITTFSLSSDEIPQPALKEYAETLIQSFENLNV